ncbi:ORF080 [Infectious spleen and kidney necrosis virus]|nr:ORF080 [Infectious spleen and kidney necrosis virus]
MLFDRFIYNANARDASLVIAAHIPPPVVHHVICMLTLKVITVHSEDVDYLCYVLCWHALSIYPHLCVWRALSIVRRYIPPGVTNVARVQMLFTQFAHKPSHVQPVLCEMALLPEVCKWNVPVMLKAGPIIHLSVHNLHLITAQYYVTARPVGGTSHTLVVGQKIAHLHNTNAGCAFPIQGLGNGTEGTTVLFGELLATGEFDVYDCATVDDYLWMNGRCNHMDRMRVFQTKMGTMYYDSTCPLRIKSRAMFSVASARMLLTDKCDGLVFVPPTPELPALLWQPKPTVYLLCSKGQLYATGSAVTVGPLIGGPECQKPHVVVCAVSADGWVFVREAPHKLYPDSIGQVNLTACVHTVDAEQVCAAVEAL